MRTVNTDRLNQFWNEGILQKVKELTERIAGISEKIDVLDTKEEIEANTDEEKMAGALAVKEMFGQLENSNLTSMFKILTAIIPSTSIPGGSYKRIGLSYTVPDGYKVISAINFGVSGSSYANVFVFSSDSIIIGNVASGAITINGSVTLLLCKEGLM